MRRRDVMPLLLAIGLAWRPGKRHLQGGEESFTLQSQPVPRTLHLSDRFTACLESVSDRLDREPPTPCLCHGDFGASNAALPSGHPAIDELLVHRGAKS
jgi:hypothetical protein